MGACTVKMNMESDFHGIPDLYYLDRTNECVLFITKDQISKTSFKSLLPFYEDSAIIYLSASEFMIAGGKKPSNKLSKKVFRINTSLKQIYSLQPLPLAARSGNLIYYKGFIYLVGAVTMREGSELPCPMCRYSLNEEPWEILEVSDLHLNAKYSLDNILGPQACIQGSILYTFGGTKSAEGRQTKKIFSIFLADRNMRIEMEKFKLPQKLSNMRCVFYGKDLMVCGEVQNQENKNCIIYSYSFSQKRWSELDNISGEFK